MNLLLHILEGTYLKRVFAIIDHKLKVVMNDYTWEYHQKPNYPLI